MFGIALAAGVSVLSLYAEPVFGVLTVDRFGQFVSFKKDRGE